MIKTKIILLVLVMVTLANCTAPLPVVINTATPQATITLTPDIKPSETSTPTLTPTNTPTITWTPLPTLSVQEANAKIKELLETNGGCELPCWWGITPNETVWTEALHFLNPFIFDLGQSSPYVRVENGKRHTYTEIQYYYDLPDEASIGRVTLDVKDDIVFGMTVYPPGAEYKYQLYQVLALLGIPKQIYISAQQSAPNPILSPTVLVLDYSDTGVWASYGYIPSLVGENLVICPKHVVGKVSVYDNVGGRLELFDPTMKNDQALSIQEYADMVGGFTAKKLEDVTNMNVENFYSTFIDPKTKTCLETPANLWP